MSAWPGKYAIGLTGNIATGKSVVRKMLEHLGAYGIDADKLAHRAVAQGSPGYQSVVDLFGKWILSADGQVDRAKLARVVFSDPEALSKLEAIVHPLVGQAVDILVRRSQHAVVVIEAIKLIESGLVGKCDTLWVTYAPQELQLARLMQKRGMNEVVARQRIVAQPAQEIKTATAHVIIRNDGSFDDTWQQVYTAWQRIFPSFESESRRKARSAIGAMIVHRAGPRDAGEIAKLINQLSEGRRRVSRDEVMAAFGEKAFLLLKSGEKSLGVAGWKVENLVARTDEIYLDRSVSLVDGLQVFMNEVESTSRELQCEISLLFLPKKQAKNEAVFNALGYQQRNVNNLGVNVWAEAAEESMPPDSIMLFKPLRSDRVLKPV